MAADPSVHKRYLDYRETYGYFARGQPLLDYASFAAADAELRALAARSELDDDEEARRAELEALLFRD
ncbi:MAG: hypothetical protein IPF92_00570 [Myxococcales bacterium]|nr:hypothetical protein [Myxococcales bacterium]MBL0193625.1 hypothetical protein [Myxococcales bacterium]HQY63250.1 hypothetical protein [Polyangiaceae bacterium]